MPNGAYQWLDGGIYGKMGDVLQVDECRFVREFGIREIRYTNYRVAVGLLVGQGWEQRRPTLPNLYVSKARLKVLVFLRLNYLFEENQWLKTMSFVNSICPHTCLLTGQQLR